ncbi:polyprenyl synthetase family protein [Streptomyces sp. NPDC050211]|uniref:polyprenyl synthetase family protein n=1 Tax=Streptomyces sp. NPDC050211 TaxID=3154932 RepID=UPI0034294357
MDAYLERLIADEEARLLGLSGELAPLVSQLRSAVGCGKRLRATFLYWGWRAAGQPDCEDVLQAAAAMELVHAAAVTHDDIIDNSRTRHGRPTAHVAFASSGAPAPSRAPADWDASSQGPGSPHGRPAALAMLLGDLLMGYAGHVFTTCGLPGAYLARTVPLWSELLRETVAGEFLEVLRTGSTARCVAESLEVARYKTAKYTVERPLHLGATLGGAREDVLRAFTAYGLALGEAFQLRDDVLGTFGDPALTGKSVLDDVRGAKPTALLAIATARALGPDKRLLDKLVGDPDLDEAGGERLREVMERCGARQEIEAMITDRIAAARAALDLAPMPPTARGALDDLAGTATDRAL